MAIHRTMLSAVVMAVIVITMALPSVQRTVYVTNKLSDRILIVHCRSKDDDLKGHAVAIGDSVPWSFEINSLGTRTVFTCKLAVKDKRISFVAFEEGGDNSERWNVEDDGVYGSMMNGEKFFKAAWKQGLATSKLNHA